MTRWQGRDVAGWGVWWWTQPSTFWHLWSSGGKHLANYQDEQVNTGISNSGRRQYQPPGEQHLSWDTYTKEMATVFFLENWMSAFTHWKTSLETEVTPLQSALLTLEADEDSRTRKFDSQMCSGQIKKWGIGVLAPTPTRHMTFAGFLL